MKILKNRHDLLRLFTILFIVLSVVCVFVSPGTIINSGYFNWLFLFVCLLFFAIPPKTPESLEHVPLKKPFLIVSLFQWSALAIFFGFTQLCGHWLALYTHPHLYLFKNSLHKLWIHYGFFPWPMVALFTMVFSRHLKEQDTYPHLLLRPLLLSEADNTSGLLFNALTRGSFTLILCTTIAIGALSIAYLIAPNTLHAFLGFQPVVLILLIALFAFVASKKAQHYWRIIATNPAIKPFMVLITMMIVLGLAIFIALGVSMALSSPHQKSLSIIKFLLRNGWGNYWWITNFCFWLLWVMPLSLWFARLLKGAKRQKILALVLFWPVIWAVLSWVYEKLDWDIPLNTTLSIFILLAGIVVFFVLISQQARWQITLRGYAEMLTEKNRPATRLFRNLAMMSTMLLYLYWQSGVIGISLAFVFIAMPLGLLSLLSLINLITR